MANLSIKKGNILNKILVFFSIFIIIIFSLFLGGVSYWLLFYIHEIGHVIFASCLNLVFRADIPAWYFSKWESHSIPNQLFRIFELPVPVQTHVIGNHPLIGFGGIFLTTAVAILLVLWIREKVELKKSIVVYSIPVIVFLDEIFMNFVCGYDDGTLISYPLEYCSSITFYIQNFVPVLFAIPICYLVLNIVHLKRVEISDNDNLQKK